MKRIWHLVKKLLKRLTRSGEAVAMSRPAAMTFMAQGSYRIVTGPAAMGKSTMMRVHAAEEMSRPGRRVMAVTASELAARQLTELPEYDPGRHFAGTARALCCSLLSPENLTTKEDILGRALTALDRHPDARTPYSVVLVDDAQNLSPSMIRLIDRITEPTGHDTTYFIDPGQAIFAFAGATTETLALLRARAGHRVMRLRERRRPIGTRTEPLTAEDAEEAVALATDLAAELFETHGGSVGLLTRTNAEALDAATRLSRRGVHHLLLTARLIAEDDPEGSPMTEPWRHWAIREADLSPTLAEGITIATAHTARDREMDRVVVLDTALPAVDGRSGLASLNPEEERRLATAASRARLTATIVTVR